MYLFLKNKFIELFYSTRDFLLTPYSQVQWRLKQRVTQQHYLAHFNFLQAIIIAIFSLLLTNYCAERLRDRRSYLAANPLIAQCMRCLAAVGFASAVFELLRPLLRQSQEEKYLQNRGSVKFAQMGLKLDSIQQQPHLYDPVLSQSMLQSAARHSLAASDSPQRPNGAYVQQQQQQHVAQSPSANKIRYNSQQNMWSSATKQRATLIPTAAHHVVEDSGNYPLTARASGTYPSFQTPKTNKPFDSDYSPVLQIPLDKAGAQAAPASKNRSYTPTRLSSSLQGASLSTHSNLSSIKKHLSVNLSEKNIQQPEPKLQNRGSWLLHRKEQQSYENQ